jgi:hypothetical protein
MFVQSLRTIALIFFTGVLEGTLTPLYACSCDTTPPPCRALWQSDTVFSGRVDKIEFVEAPPPEYSHYRVTFAVDRVLRGAPTSQLTIKTASSGASCGYEFHEGEFYVVYGYSQRGAIWTGRCGRTRPLREAVEDLDYAATLSAPGAGALIYGQLRRWDDYLGRSPVTKDLGGMADVPVIVEGPGGPFQTRSGQDGRFQMAGLQEGTYRVSLQLPAALMYNGSADPIRLADVHACERADFSVHFDGRLNGTVQDANGAPVVGANIVLALAELGDVAAGVRYNRSAVTDKDGVFELRTLPPGHYVVGLNIDPHFENMAILPGKDGRWIWPRVFYPGVSGVTDATRIDLGPGEKRTLAPFRLPETLVVRPVAGVARWPDGHAVAEGWVSLLDATTKLRLSGVVRTTKAGEFEVAAFAGQRVFVQVEGKDNGRTGYVESPVLEIGPGAPPEQLTLTIKPRPY